MTQPGGLGLERDRRAGPTVGGAQSTEGGGHRPMGDLKIRTQLSQLGYHWVPMMDEYHINAYEYETLLRWFSEPARPKGINICEPTAENFFLTPDSHNMETPDDGLTAIPFRLYRADLSNCCQVGRI